MNRNFSRLVSAFALLTVLILCSCSTQKVIYFPERTPDEPVRAVIFKDTPEDFSVAEHARRIGNEYYPKVRQCLGVQSNEAPAHFKIIFQNHIALKTIMNDESGGFVRGGNIYLGLDWLTNSPENLDQALIHEMAHIAQHYSRRAPLHWTEGLAAYVQLKLLASNEWYCAECSARYPHYSSGYGCAAAFLLFIEAYSDDHIVAELHRQLRGGVYSDEFFQRKTGQPLPQLWEAFQTTSAFKPSATKLLNLEDSLGYVRGKPGPTTSPDAWRKVARARSLAIMEEKPGGALIADAFLFLDNLKTENRLPGWNKNAKGTANFTFEKNGANDPQFPFHYTISAKKENDGRVYHFALLKKSADTPWQLEKSWRTDKQGRTILLP